MIACIDRLFLKVKRSLAPGRASPYELETHLVAVFRRQRVPQHPDRFEHPALRDQSGIERLEARLARGPCDELLRFRVVAPLEHGGPPFGKGGVSHDVEAGRIEGPQGARPSPIRQPCLSSQRGPPLTIPCVFSGTTQSTGSGCLCGCRLKGVLEVIALYSTMIAQ